jgi:hypothetical protein
VVSPADFDKKITQENALMEMNFVERSSRAKRLYHGELGKLYCPDHLPR